MNLFTLNTRQKYIPIWRKYRPAILSLMLNCEKEPQKYQMSGHEFRDADPKPKGGYSFVLQMNKGRPINDIRDSIIAKELVYVLRHSAKATELTDQRVYNFGMNKDFLLMVSQEELPEEKNVESEDLVDEVEPPVDKDDPKDKV